MTDNRLKLNGEKTHLMLMMTDQARRSKPAFKLSIEIEGETIETSRTETMLGGIIRGEP